MATIENPGAAYVRRLMQRIEAKLVVQKPQAKETQVKTEKIQNDQVDVKTSQEVKQRRDPSPVRGRARENVEHKRMTLEELAEQLRKINLTFDLFEIQAKFTIDQETGDVSVEVVNQRTGEVIRKIPPYAVKKIHQAIRTGDSYFTDIKV